MCGRATVVNPDGIVEKVYGYTSRFVPGDWKPRYNVSPHQPIPVVYYDPFLKQRALRLMHWNLIPSRLATRADVDSFDSTYSTFNARIESVATAPTFSDCWRSQRCLIVVDGIIEWVGDRKYRTPHLIRRKDNRPFAMAGLWSRWRGSDGDEVWSCTVIVKDADDWYTKFHDRMAVMLPSTAHDEWIDPARTKGQMEIIERGKYRKEEELEFYPISRLVNSPRNDSPECLERGTLYEDPQADLFAQA
jgi:putative SOS response-associated peptidase YedK